jgi:hypothetical protein
MNCCICNKDRPDGERWIYQAGGEKVCSVECQERRFKKFTDMIFNYMKSHPVMDYDDPTENISYYLKLNKKQGGGETK